MRGIGPKTAERIINEVINPSTSLRIDGERSRTIKAKKGLKLEGDWLKKTADLAKFFAVIKNADSCQAPSELIRLFLEYYQPLLKEKYDDFNKRMNDLDSLERIASRYKSLEQFLADMALEPPDRNIIEAGLRDRDDSRLTLSTIHSAKGLEWHTVFLIFVAEGHLPSYLSLENEEDIEEELRLFYVAATRAKDNLFLLKPHIDRSPRGFMDQGGSVFTQISRFLDRRDILVKLVRIESAGDDIDSLQDLELEDITGKGRTDKRFFDKMKDYFEHNDERES